MRPPALICGKRLRVTIAVPMTLMSRMRRNSASVVGDRVVHRRHPLEAGIVDEHVERADRAASAAATARSSVISADMAAAAPMRRRVASHRRVLREDRDASRRRRRRRRRPPRPMPRLAPVTSTRLVR